MDWYFYELKILWFHFNFLNNQTAKCSCIVELVVLILITYSFSGARMAQWVRSLDLKAHTSLSPIRRGFAPSFVNYKKGCTRLAAASEKVYQLLAQGQWFSPGTPPSSTTKTGRHAIAEILLKVALSTKFKFKFYNFSCYLWFSWCTNCRGLMI